MSQAAYGQVPNTLTVREFHAGGKIMVTTFLCPKDTPKSMLKALYKRRWNIELDLRNIKTTLGTAHLRCKTPAMAVKELWVYLLAYNLIRLLMAQAALLADQVPRQLSFKHTVQVWIAWQQRGGATHDAVCARTTHLDCGTAGRAASRAHRAPRPQAAGTQVSANDQGPGRSTRGRAPERTPQEMTPISASIGF